jgi:predicted RNase H-like HicB family nuclease
MKNASWKSGLLNLDGSFFAAVESMTGGGDSTAPRDQRTAGQGDPSPRLQGAVMRFEGRLVHDGKWWLAEIPILDAMTQGRSRKEALEMIEDWLETMIEREGFRAKAHFRGKNEFEIDGSDTAAMIALLLRRRRQASGQSLQDIASHLGSSSRNAYARYERGETVPTIEKLDALLKATAPGRDFVIRESSD